MLQADKNDKIARILLDRFVDKTRVHVWLWCVPGMLFFVAWISLLQYLQHALAEAGNRQNINVSQYAVMISNVGGVTVEDDRLKDFGRYYGEVVAAFHVRNYGRYLTKNLEVCSFACVWALHYPLMPLLRLCSCWVTMCSGVGNVYAVQNHWERSQQAGHLAPGCRMRSTSV